MPNTLFSTYSQGENRVTATILAVFERLSFALVERIVQALCQEPETALLLFSNQPSGIQSTPDARIRASFSYWFETKTQIGSVSGPQIINHLKALDEEKGVERQRLLVLTPDAAMPKVLESIGDSRLAWANFDQLVSVIDEIVAVGEGWLMSDRPLPTEQERTLLRELVRFLVSEKLIPVATDQVLVVPARGAIKEYLAHNVYMCQPNRTFQPCVRIAFYVDGKIDRRVPRILSQIDSVNLSETGIARQSAELQPQLIGLLTQLVAAKSDRLGEDTKVMFLTAPTDADTFVLKQEVENDCKAANGKTTAFVQAQRYVPFERLKTSPKTTTLLVGE